MTSELEGLRVLLAEDDAMIRSILQRAARELGVVIVAVEDGVLAQSRLRSERYDVLITDLKMPNMSGLELLRFATEQLAGTAVIVMTGFAEPESEAAIAKAGALLVLKPFDTERFAEALLWGKRTAASAP